ncbi:MAG: TAXI family TRAP transporter solute-binding subunit [Micromonosporaceae bacterium]
MTVAGVSHEHGTMLRPEPPRSHRRSSHWHLLVPVAALLALATVSTTGATGHLPEPPYSAGTLPIAAGERDAVYYSYGLGLVEAIRIRAPKLEPYLVVTPSSQRNVELTAEGKTRMAFGRADIVSNLAPSQRRRLTALARLYDDYLHLVVRRDSAIHDLSDLRGRRVSIGLERSGTQRAVIPLLAQAGIQRSDLTPRKLGASDSAQALREGEIDAFFFFGGVPTDTLKLLDNVQPTRLIDLARWAGGLGPGYSDHYTTLTIPASAYGGQKAITTVGLPNYLMVPRDLDPDLAYALTSILFEQRELIASAHPAAYRLDRRAAINTGPLPLHPGALRYYRDTQN